ncbi:hypothetical protein D9M71_115580 [compost metagenome]
MRQGHGVGQGEQRRFDQRLLLVHVEAGAEDAFFLQCLDQRGFVDHLAAGDVDQDGAGLHQLKLALADQLAGGVAERHHQADEIRLGQQFVESAVARGEFLFQFRLAVVAVVEHLHAEAEVPAPGDGCADAAEAEDAEFLAVHVDAELRGVDGALPLAGLGPGVQLGGASSGAQQQGEAEVGGGFGEHVGGVGQRDAALVEIGDVVVVVADRDAGDHFQLAGLLQLLGAQRAADADHAVGFRQGGGVLGVDVAQLGIEHGDVELAAQAFEMFGGEAAEDEDVLFHDGTVAGKREVNPTIRSAGGDMGSIPARHLRAVIGQGRWLRRRSAGRSRHSGWKYRSRLPARRVAPSRSSCPAVPPARRA